jgi:hypothetical protein
MTRADELLDALWNAAVAGDFEAAVFLKMFAPWAALNAQVPGREVAGVEPAELSEIGNPHSE